MKEDFASPSVATAITFEFITNLKRGTIFDRQPLRGHEDKLGEYGDKVYWRMRKKGISMHELDRDLAAIDLRKAAKGNLRTWADEDVKWETIDRLGDVGANLRRPVSARRCRQEHLGDEQQRPRALRRRPFQLLHHLRHRGRQRR
jgi:hypothetical protein